MSTSSDTNNNHSSNNTLKPSKIKYNTNCNSVFQKMKEFQNKYPNQTITYEIIKSFITENENETKNKPQIQNKSKSKIDEERQRQAHQDFCDAFDF
jgi:hypothetical protein